MKKNLLSILILALLVVNLVLTAIMMFSVTGAMNKTSKLVTDISSVLNIELNATNPGEQESVSMEDTEIYVITDRMNITLRPGDDGKSHYYIVNVSLSINTKHDDYKRLNAQIAEKESVVKSTINEIISGYTYEEALADQTGLRASVLTGIQELFESDFIYSVNLEYMFQ